MKRTNYPRIESGLELGKGGMPDVILFNFEILPAETDNKIERIELVLNKIRVWNRISVKMVGIVRLRHW